MSSPVLISELQADLADSDVSTAQTVNAMAAHIRAALSDPVVQRVALTLAGGSRRETAARVWAWIKQNVRFVSDEEQLERLLGRADELELLISPPVLLRARVRQGDCDDFTMLACSLLLSLGCPALIKTFKCERSDPGRWSHVCAAAVLEDGAVFPVDASHGDYAGWEVPARDVFDSQLWDMHGQKVGATMKRKTGGLGGYTPAPGWTGSEMTTTGGPQAGIYPSRDFMRAYYPGARSRGLQGIARGRFGLGSCVGGYDEYGVACADFTQAVDSLPPGATFDLTSGVTTNADGSVISGPGYSTFNPSSSSSSGSFNFASFLASLVPTAAKLTSQALQPGAVQLANGNVLLPNGQIVSSAPTNTLGSISPTMLLLGGGLILVVVLMSKK